MKGRGVIMATGQDERCTPRLVLDPLVSALGPIALDPCGHPDSSVGARRTVLLPRYEPLPSHSPLLRSGTVLFGDGLDLDWESYTHDGWVWCNPPYSRGAWGRFAARALRGWLAHGVESVCLIAARTDTRAWHALAPPAPAIAFWRGRIRFEGCASGAPFPSALLYYGHRPTDFARALEAHAHVIVNHVIVNKA